MCDGCFSDRRPDAGPGDGDWQTPVGRDSLVEANHRVRSATPAYRMDSRNTQIRTLAVQRHRSRRSGDGDFPSVGHYLEFLRDQGTAS